MKSKNLKSRLITEWRVIALLDFDTFEAYRAFPERARFVGRTFRVDFKDFTLSRYRTARGWHIVVYHRRRTGRRLKLYFMVALQALLGSDWKRETFNLYRAGKVDNAPKDWQKLTRWNTLYSHKLEGSSDRRDEQANGSGAR